MTIRSRIVPLVLLGLLVPASQCQHADRLQPPDGSADAGRPQLPPVTASKGWRSVEEMEQRAAGDPLAFLKYCRQRYARHVHDYRCRFRKQERIDGELTTVQSMVVEFRERPYSVDMHWVENPGRAKRVAYVAGRWVENGREMALIEPSGLLGLLAPQGVKRDIHGPEVRRNARRTIDQFGFKNTFDLIIKFCEAAKDDSRYSLRYVGRGEIDGRQTLMFERRLPFAEPDHPWPDRILVVHIDAAWLVPTACFAYADEERRVLLGSYVTTDVEFNVGLIDADF